MVRVQQQKKDKLTVASIGVLPSGSYLDRRGPEQRRKGKKRRGKDLNRRGIRYSEEKT